ncbi:unnamed protein product, partial [Ectocarpus sp. 12 AP-2014]
LQLPCVPLGLYHTTYGTTTHDVTILTLPGSCSRYPLLSFSCRVVQRVRQALQTCSPCACTVLGAAHAMTPPATTSAASLAVVAFTLLGSLLPTSSFVPLASRGQAPRQSSRRPPPSSSRFAGPLQMTIPAPRQRQQRRQIFMPAGASCANLAGHQRRITPSGGREEVSLPRPRRCRSLQPLGLGGMDEMEDMDPLEAGPDPDEILLQGEP